jgi:hypothetical protein
VLGTVLLGLSTGEPSSPSIALGLTMVFVPSATAVLLADVARKHSTGRRWSIAAIVLLFSGLCGQAWLLGGALESLFAGTGRGTPALLLAVLLAACGQYLAAASLVRSFAATGRPGGRDADEIFSAGQAADASPRAESSPGLLLLLASAALGAGLFAAIANVRAFPEIFAGRTLAYAALGLLPGIGGLVAGAQSARAEWKVFPGEAVNGLLMRLGRGGFYFDVFLFLFVLVPLRGVAGLARFVDWAVIDTLATGGPASLFESAASFFGPLQHRGVFFYLFSAVLGTFVLSLLMIWLQG